MQRSVSIKLAPAFWTDSMVLSVAVSATQNRWVVSCFVMCPLCNILNLSQIMQFTSTMTIEIHNFVLFVLACWHGIEEKVKSAWQVRQINWDWRARTPNLFWRSSPTPEWLDCICGQQIQCQPIMTAYVLLLCTGLSWASCWEQTYETFWWNVCPFCSILKTPSQAEREHSNKKRI